MESLPEVTFLFPENQPKQVVENMNENNEVPTATDLLSEQNSRAQNNTLLADRRNQPFSEGNTFIENLAARNQSRDEQSFRKNYIESKPFSRNALLDNGSGSTASQSARENNFKQPAQSTVRKKDGTDNRYDQTEFSADVQGDITLSTYAWDWAYYMNMFKKKLYEVWRTPPAYHVLGMIDGNTLMDVTIDRDGKLIKSITLDHNGHQSLRMSSENAIKNTFPFAPLPVDFPDNTLTIKVNLIYPGSKKGN
ncbi:MAG: hypothetical protein GY839_21060 [candidate division Zixibacteria bacterium]|nr:hypothetical protein [candidate division Zixibacteria bacterium]